MVKAIWLVVIEFTRKVVQKEKQNPPYPPFFECEASLVMQYLSSEMLSADFTEDVYGEKEKDPKLQKKTININCLKTASRINSSYQHP